MPHRIVRDGKRRDSGYRLRYSSCQIQMVFSSTIWLWVLEPSFIALPSGFLVGLLTETDRLTHPEVATQKKRIMQ